MTRPRILRARLRARSFTSPNDVRAAVQRLSVKFFRRLIDTDQDRYTCADLYQRWRDHRAAVELMLRENATHAHYWDLALGALLRCCEMAREAGHLRAKMAVRS